MHNNYGFSNTLPKIGLGINEHQKNKTPRYKAHQSTRTPTPPVTKDQIVCNRFQQTGANTADSSSCLFNDKLDLCSESEIIGDCETLNSKIREAALTLVGDWETSLSSSRRRKHTLAKGETKHHLKSTLGESIYYKIKQLSSPHIQAPMTDALQGLAVNAAFDIISTQFCPGLSPDTDKLMHETFKHMLTAGTLLPYAFFDLHHLISSKRVRRLLFAGGQWHSYTLTMKLLSRNSPNFMLKTWCAGLLVYSFLPDKAQTRSLG